MQRWLTSSIFITQNHDESAPSKCVHAEHAILLYHNHRCVETQTTLLVSVPTPRACARCPPHWPHVFRAISVTKLLALQLADPESRSQRPRAKRRVSRALEGSTVQPNVRLMVLRRYLKTSSPRLEILQSPGCIAPQVVPDHQQRAGTSRLPAHLLSRGSNSIRVRCPGNTVGADSQRGPRRKRAWSRGLAQG